MPLKNTGNKISDIKVTTHKVTITFTSDDMIIISNEAYLSTYLYEGKELSLKEIKDLVNLSDIEELYTYACKLLSNRYYSEKKITIKLLFKNRNRELVNRTINKLKNNNLIDDKKYTELYIEDANNKGYGKYKIIKKLEHLGISDDIVSKIKFPKDVEISKALNELPKLIKKYSRYNDALKVKHIKQALLADGYDHDVVEKISKQIKYSSRESELEKLRNDYIKYRIKLIKRYDGNELKNKCIYYLSHKGYNLSDIKSVVEEKK